MFPDKNLQSAIMEALSKAPGEEIFVSDLNKLTTFTAFNCSIIDISGLEYCINMSKLDLNSNQISDISALSSLAKLNVLRLPYNQVRDVSPLSKLANLTQLYLPHNQISDISPLSSLANLTTLSLWQNQSVLADRNGVFVDLHGQLSGRRDDDSARLIRAP